MKRAGVVFPALLVFRRLYLSEAGFTGLEDLQDYLACYSVLFSFFIFCRFLNAVLRLLRAVV